MLKRHIQKNEGFKPRMSLEEAHSILNTPSKRYIDISTAHKNLLMINHPDMGGSPFLAAKINEAKDLLMKKYRMT
ncbi:Molecular chaperone (DnaJ superfamily) [Trachipleistophora hominis]|uniref:Molecular chaperone (DnaJ superfamily) n=1 Tax=Trachipleistophora hominis TaxID=72359 RepID=L7JVA2_TRAHO|nr:Molecular chaperone (DnaJ superfamily) [Trachipleistophora hominis]